MKDITSLTVTEKVVFATDIIPFKEVFIASNIKNYISPFLFRKVEVLEDGANIVGLQALQGEYEFEGAVYPIESLIIGSNRITYQMEAETKVSNMFYMTLAASLNKMNPDKQFEKKKPSLKTTETACVVTLEVDYKKVFSSAFYDFATKHVKRVASNQVNEVAEVTVQPMSLLFSVDYCITDKKLKRSNVSIEVKRLAIEPRIGTDPKDNRFFTSSPTDSDTHLKLVADFEKAIGKVK